METSTLIQKWISMKFSSNLFQIKPYLRLNTRVNWCKSRSSREITENLWLSKYFLGINSSSYIAPACKDGGASSLFLSPTRPSMLFFAVSCGCLKVRLCNADAADPLAFSRLVFRAFLRVASWRKKKKGETRTPWKLLCTGSPFFYGVEVYCTSPWKSDGEDVSDKRGHDWRIHCKSGRGYWSRLTLIFFAHYSFVYAGLCKCVRLWVPTAKSNCATWTKSYHDDET